MKGSVEGVGEQLVTENGRNNRPQSHEVKVEHREWGEQVVNGLRHPFGTDNDQCGPSNATDYPIGLMRPVIPPKYPFEDGIDCEGCD